MDKEKISNLTNGHLDIFKFYIQDLPPISGNKTSRNFNSVFREEKNPSTSLYNKNGVWNYKDFGSDGDHLDGIAFVQKKFNLSFPEALERINQDLNLGFNKVVKPEIKHRDKFTESEAEYWKGYGIKAEVLKSLKVQSVESYILKGKEKSYTITSTKEDPIFSYQVSEDCYKLYRPFNEKYKFSWLGVKPSNYVFGGHSPDYDGTGTVFITGGEKDVLTLVSHGYDAVCFNSETSIPSIETIELLKSRWEDIYVLYDIDETGLKQSEKLCKQYGFKRVILPELLRTQLAGKDVSDFFQCFIDGSVVFSNPEVFHVGCVEELIENAESFEIDHFADTTKMIETLPQEGGKDTGFEMDFNYKKKFTKPALTLNDVSLMNIGEVFTLVALPGSGKSQTIETIAAGFIAKRSGIKINSFGFSDNIPEDKACLVIDMERPHDQCKDGYDRIYKRLENNIDVVTDGNVFKNLLYKCWIDFVGVKERKEAFESLVSTGQYGLVMLDGILGVVNDLNDTKESSEVIQWLIGLANKYQFALIVTMHPNKGTDTMAGHIGAFLYRYSRACLLLRSNSYDKEVKEITSDFAQQKVSYGGKVCSMFRYSEEHGMFMAEETEPEAPKSLSSFSSNRITQIFNEFSIKGINEVPIGQAKTRLSELTGKGIETSKKHIEAAFEAGILDRVGKGKATKYYLKNN